MNTYPCWLYSESGAVLLHSKAQEDALLGAWVDSPAKVGKAVVLPEIQNDLLDLIESQESAVDTPIDKPKRGRPAKQ